MQAGTAGRTTQADKMTLLCLLTAGNAGDPLDILPLEKKIAHLGAVWKRPRTSSRGSPAGL